MFGFTGFGLTGFRLAIAIAGPLLILALISGLAWSRSHWKGKYDAISSEAGVLLYEVRQASGNQKLKWKDAPAQVRALGTSLTEWKAAAAEQSATIDRMAFDARRMQKLNAEYRAKAEVELRKRQAAFERLDAQASDPGDRADCIAQIKAAEAALDAIYEAGL